MKTKLLTFTIALLLWAVFSAASASAWGLKGHTIIGVVATAHFPDELPAFVRTPSAKNEITYLQAEEDRLKIGEDSQVAWAREWPSDHYLDLGDDARVAGTIAIEALPATRDDFEQALLHGARPIDAYKVGFLPYAILEGYEQVRSDFALWRLANDHAKLAAQLSSAAGAQAATEVGYREALTIHDIGIVSHFVGDASQPLHVSIHFNGWGNYPNPRGFSNDRTTHAEFESDFVEHFITPQLVMQSFQSPAPLSAIPLAEIEHYLQTTNSYVVPFYVLQARGGFVLTDAASPAHRDAVQFTAARLAAASQMLDSLILTAWRTSADLRDSGS